MYLKTDDGQRVAIVGFQMREDGMARLVLWGGDIRWLVPAEAARLDTRMSYGFHDFEPKQPMLKEPVAPQGSGLGRQRLVPVG